MLYWEKLKDPRWQKKRLLIFERDNYTCQKCSDTESCLNVHHLIYLPHTDPWNYDNNLLITLCESCHESELRNMPMMESGIIDALKSRFLSEDIQELICGFNKIELQHTSNVVATAISWAIQTPEIQRELINRYMAQLKQNHLASLSVSTSLLVVNNAT
jgi:hypothetical protein